MSPPYPSSTVPSAVSSLAQRAALNVSTWHTAGQLDLLVDARTRVRLRPGRRPESVQVEVRLAALPSAARESEELLSRALLQVTATATESVGIPVLSSDGAQLLLQAEIDGSDLLQFNTALELFLNETDRWSAVLRKTLS